jgi:AraC family transcriptional activator of pobA
MTANEMQQHRLLMEAQRLLIYTSASAVQIAAELGFQDPAYFSRFFKRHTGLTPLAFRQARAG